MSKLTPVTTERNPCALWRGLCPPGAGSGSRRSGPRRARCRRAWPARPGRAAGDGGCCVREALLPGHPGSGLTHEAYGRVKPRGASRSWVLRAEPWSVLGRAMWRSAARGGSTGYALAKQTGLEVRTACTLLPLIPGWPTGAWSRPAGRTKPQPGRGGTYTPADGRAGPASATGAQASKSGGESKKATKGGRGRPPSAGRGRGAAP